MVTGFPGCHSALGIGTVIALVDSNRGRDGEEAIHQTGAGLEWQLGKPQFIRLTSEEITSRDK